jgi:hypothetical protein
MLRYTELKDTRLQFLTITGVPPEEFERYLPQFSAAYDKLYPQEKAVDGQPRQQRTSSSGQCALGQMEDKLLFIWMYHKVQWLPPALGVQFGLSQSQVNNWIDRLLPVFQLALANLTIISLSPNCVQFLQLLNSCQVEYLVIGGHAVAFHGYQRPILDLDIFIATHPLNAHKLVQVLQTFGPGVAPQTAEYFQLKERVIRIGQPPFTVEQFAPDDRFIQLGNPPTQLEIMTSISAVTFEECYLERVAGVIDNVPVQIIGLPQLKINKQASIRAKDADDLAHLS